MMTAEQVQERVRAIAQSSGDYEAAHSLEDKLFRDVVRETAAGNPDAQILAVLALESLNLDFPRHCA